MHSASSMARPSSTARFQSSLLASLKSLPVLKLSPMAMVRLLKVKVKDKLVDAALDVVVDADVDVVVVAVVVDVL